MKPSVLITGESHPVLAAGLTHMGFDVVNMPQIDAEELMQRIGSVTGLILTSRLSIDAAVLSNAHQLQWIGRLGSGLDVVDLVAATNRGVRVISSPEGNRQAVAEHTLGLLINLIRNQSKSDREVRKGIWDRNTNRGVEFGSLTVGLIGYGHTGECTGRLLNSVGFTVLAYDKYRFDFGGDWVTETDLDRIRQEADIVSLHLPLTSETTGLVDDAWIHSFAKPIWLINTSRGPITPLAPLVEGLRSGNLRGLALDVLPKEPLRGYSDQEKQELDLLCSFGNVLLTPHIAGYSQESPERMARVLLEKLGLGN
ncbi:MAG: NAD(P)-dependent oxidoreductase [Bacteroidota bacterium]